MNGFISQKTEKTYSLDEWNNMSDYFFANGLSEQDCAAYKERVLELDHEWMCSNRRETRRHISIEENFDQQADSNHSADQSHNTIDYLMYKSGQAEPGAENEVIANDEMRLLHSAINQLRPMYQDIIHAIYFNGLSRTEYGYQSGITPQAASQRLKKAEKKLAIILESTFKTSGDLE